MTGKVVDLASRREAEVLAEASEQLAEAAWARKDRESIDLLIASVQHLMGRLGGLSDRIHVLEMAALEAASPDPSPVWIEFNRRQERKRRAVMRKLRGVKS